MLKLMTAMTVAALLLLVAMPVSVSANEVDKVEQTQEITWECSSNGTYGQNHTCKGTAKQNQYILRRNGKYVKKHNIGEIPTGIPAASAVVTGLISATGAGFYLLKRV